MYHRKTGTRKSDDSDGNEEATSTVESEDSENEQGSSEFEGKIAQRTKIIPQSSDTTNSFLDAALAKLPPRWRNWIVRLIFSFFMIIGFIIIIYLGPLALLLLTLALQVGCFREIVSVGYVVYSVHRFPKFRTMAWYFLFVANYFFYGEALIKYFGVVISKVELLQLMVRHHRFISFALYIIGFIWFVLTLVKKFYMKQFSLYAWTHIALLIVVAQSYFIMQNMFEGLVWFIVPVSMIICNDIFAYVFGFFFGKTPLIELSPKKTWEGFVGGAICTVIFGFIISHKFCEYEFFLCPVEQYSILKENNSTFKCVPSATFQLQEYSVPSYLVVIVNMLGYAETVQIYPFVLHSLALSLFSSIIGPFGGFFASGFKRAFKVKDFGAVIPGHGGVTDRFDCQLLMATFVHVYFHSFIRAPNINSVLKQIYTMQESMQLEVFLALNKTLYAKGLL